MHDDQQLLIPGVGDLVPRARPTGFIPNLEETVRTWLTSEIANGTPREDTVKGYRNDLGHWFKWCEINGVNPGCPCRQNVEGFRAELIAAGSQAPTIARKLTVIRRFYESAKNNELLTHNPAAGVKAPTDRRVRNQKKNLTNGQAERLIEALPSADTLRGKRDRLIIGLMLLEGMRRVELHRANDEDLQQETLYGPCLLVHGKIRDREKFPRKDTLAALEDYLQARGPVLQEEGEINGRKQLVTPLICNIGKGGKPGGRISRIGLNYIVDGYLKKAGIKNLEDKKGEHISCHALRHTFATILYQETKDLKAVQDELGHAHINTTAIYAASGHERERYSELVPLKI